MSSSRAAMGPDALKKVVVKARTGDFDAQETLRTELRYYEMLEASPGMLGEDDKQSLTIIRTGLGSAARTPVTAPRRAESPEPPGPEFGDEKVEDLVMRVREKNLVVDRAVESAPFPRTAVFVGNPGLVEAMNDEASLMRELAKQSEVKLSTSAEGVVPPMLEVLKTFEDVQTDFKASEKDLRASGGDSKAALKALAKAPVEILSRAEEVLAKTGPNRRLLAAFHRRAGDPIVAPHIARALGKMGARAVPALIDALAEPDTCRDAVAALGAIGPDAKDAGLYLMKLLDGPYANEASEALRKIGVTPEMSAAARSRESGTLTRDQLENEIVEAAGLVKSLAGVYRGMITDLSLLKPDAPEYAAKKRAADDLRENTYIPANDRFVALALQYRSTYGADALFALADAHGFRDMVR